MSENKNISMKKNDCVSVGNLWDAYVCDFFVDCDYRKSCINIGCLSN